MKKSILASVALISFFSLTIKSDTIQAKTGEGQTASAHKKLHQHGIFHKKTRMAQGSKVTVINFAETDLIPQKNSGSETLSSSVRQANYEHSQAPSTLDFENIKIGESGLDKTHSQGEL